MTKKITALQWRHYERDGVSNYRRLDCLINLLFRRRQKKTSKLRVTDLCGGIHRWTLNSPHKWPVTRKILPFNDAIINITWYLIQYYSYWLRTKIWTWPHKKHHGLAMRAIVNTVGKCPCYNSTSVYVPRCGKLSDQLIGVRRYGFQQAW